MFPNFTDFSLKLTGKVSNHVGILFSRVDFDYFAENTENS